MQASELKDGSLFYTERDMEVRNEHPGEIRVDWKAT